MTQETSTIHSTKTMKLTKRNYYTNRANWDFQSATWFKKFMDCEAEALAELSGEWTPDSDQMPLLVGNYLHSYFQSPQAHSGFKRSHPQILSSRGPSKGKPKKDYQVADAMISSLRGDQTFRELYQGDKELIVQGEIAGVPWMGKLDCFGPTHKYFVDLKTTQDLHKRYWVDDLGGYGTFIDAYHYTLQMAVYQDLVRQQFGVDAVPLIVAVTKQDPPDKAIVEIPQEELDYWLAKVIELQERIEAVKRGEVEPTRCGKCDYCRATKKLTGTISLYDLRDRG